MAENSTTLCDEPNVFKTGTDFQVRIELEIDSEVVTALPQIITILYYLLDGKRNEFSYWAVNTSDAKVVAKVTELGITIRQITFDSEIILLDVPTVDTDLLKIENCKDVDVFADIQFVDSNGDAQKAIVCEDDNADTEPDCDAFVGKMVKANSEGWV